MFFQTVVNLILDGVHDREEVVKQALKITGKKETPSSSSCFRKLGDILHAVKKYTDKKSFNSWLKEAGMMKYFKEITPDINSVPWITYCLIAKQRLWAVPQQTNKKWLCKVYRRAEGEDAIHDTQLNKVRGAKGDFFTVAEILKSRFSFWKQLHESLEPPERTVDEKIKFGEKPPTATEFVPLSYQGSKRNQVSKIIGWLPDKGTLIDLFAGSGVVSLLAKKKNPNLKICLNDASFPVFAFHKTVRDDVDFLLRRLETPSNVETWSDYKQRLKSCSDPKEVAWMLYYVIYNSFNRYGTSYDSKFNNTLRCNVGKLQRCNELLRGAKITNLDFRVFADFPGTIYADPPYFGCKPGEFYNEFTTQDHLDLCEMLSSREEWFLSHSDHEFVRKIYGKFPVKEIKVRRTGKYLKSQDQELLFYRIEVQRTILKRFKWFKENEQLQTFIEKFGQETHDQCVIFWDGVNACYEKSVK